MAARRLGHNGGTATRVGAAGRSPMRPRSWSDDMQAATRILALALGMSAALPAAAADGVAATVNGQKIPQAHLDARIDRIEARVERLEQAVSGRADGSAAKPAPPVQGNAASGKKNK